MNNVAFTAPHHGAADIGLAVLRDGGNAVDATIAAAAAIAVLYPHMNGLGGDGFWLIQRPGEPPRAIDACGDAAGMASIEWYHDHGCDQIPARGPLSALTMGGTVAGWEKARQLSGASGSRPLAELMVPAASLAREGIEVTASLAAASDKVWPVLQDEAEYRQVFAPGGGPLEKGQRLRNSDLADTLEQLGRAGPADFYQGDIARSLSQELERRGSPIRFSDFSGYEAREVTPLSVRTRFGHHYNLPPPTQGLASLLILGIHNRLYRSDWSEAQRVHGIVEATKQAFRVRDREVADPRLMRLEPAELVSDFHIGDLSEQVDDRAAPWPWPAEDGDTVWMGGVDRDGTMVSFIQSLYWEFGSGVVTPGTGIVWNNRGLSFSLDREQRRALVPGHKPFHTLNPALAVLDDGRRVSYGTMGGEGQPQTQAAMVTRYLHDGLSLQDAISRGRWLLGRTWGDPDDDLKLEADLAERIGDSLRSMGHDFKTVPLYSEMMGHAGAVVRHSGGSVESASDPRSDGAGREASC